MGATGDWACGGGIEICGGDTTTCGGQRPQKSTCRGWHLLGAGTMLLMMVMMIIVLPTAQVIQLDTVVPHLMSQVLILLWQSASLHLRSQSHDHLLSCNTLPLNSQALDSIWTRCTSCTHCCMASCSMSPLQKWTASSLHSWHAVLCTTMLTLLLQLQTNKVNKFGGCHTLIFCDLNYMQKWKVTLQALNTHMDICTSRLSIKGHLRVFRPQNLAVCQYNVLKIWKYAQLTDLDVVVLILKYEKILVGHSHGKNAQNVLTNHPKYPCLTRISPKSLLYIKNDTGHTSCSQIYL